MATPVSAGQLVVPFVLYLLGVSAAAWAPRWYPLVYTGVVVVVGAATWALWPGRPLVTPHRRLGPAVLVGIVGIVLWIGLSELRLEQRLIPYLPEALRPQPRVGYNPFHELAPWTAWLLVVVRLIGLAVLVPLVEELFWRGFLLRWLVAPDWQRVPPGQFGLGSFVGVTILFTLAHPEWLAAAVYCALLNGLMCWRKDLWSCIVAHGISNLLLGIYVLVTSAWWLW
jgi:CAAX prenyl protease-like protein